MLRTSTGQHVATLPVARNETLLDCLLRRGHPIRTVCHGSLACGGCRVVVEEGLEELAAPNPSEQALLAKVGRGEPRARLACQVVLPAGCHEVVVSTDYWVPAQT